MARPQNRKRHRGDDPSQHHLPPKKARLNSRPSQSSNFAPEFYDDLSERSGLRLTPRALRELDRRNGEIQLPKYTIPDTSFTTLAEFARQNRRGGPNLCHLRGYTRPTSIARAMASTSSASSKAQQSTKATTVTSKSKRSSAYDANFEQHLINNNIYPPLYRFPDGCRTPKPANWEEIRRVLRAPRASLSPSRIPESAFEDFQVKNTTKSEGTVMRSVVPILAGDADILNEGHLPFVNLDSITKNTTVNPVPDFFDGAEPAAVDRQVREDLDRIIVPTKRASVPLAPNFLLEAKSPAGSLEVAERQAVLDGAHGALMMHALKNYLEKEDAYDGNAHAFTATLLGGFLKLYAHHVTAPTAHGQRPHYHTTQIKAYALTGDDDFWLEGTAAFRNLRSLAESYRNHIIEMANKRARNRSAEVPVTQGDDLVSTIEDHDGGSSPLDFYDCQLFAEPDDDDQETQETKIGLGILQTYGKDDAADQERDLSRRDTEASTAFATSFASSLTSDLSQPKLPRTPPSPSSSPGT
ncbi:hypothetical protein H9Q74_011604 [Fusarium xylarioides]|nr:hypothetical protein H9Q71_014316 [Fusarium xylarioides]KAG5815582.1 hypothetical protein H9Q74_011604 [Fusarium xylarioides]